MPELAIASEKLCTLNTCNVWVIGAHRYEKGRDTRMVFFKPNFHKEALPFALRRSDVFRTGLCPSMII